MILSNFLARMQLNLDSPVKPVTRPLQATETEFDTTATPDTIRDLKSALLHLRADDRDLWIRMGHSLKTIGEQGRGLWLDWSATSSKFDPRTEAATWHSFKPTSTGYGAVFAEAQRQGWINPASRAAQPDTSAQSDDKMIQWLASLNLLEYEKVRIEKAKAMSCRPAVLDALVKTARNDGSEADCPPFAEVEPHPEQIDPAQLLDEVVDTIRRYIVLDTEQAQAAALWAVFTWFVEVVQVAPLMVITAPEMECGKSQLRDLLSKIVKRPLSANNMKAATLFRIAEKWHPSLMLDEVDLMLKSDDEIINLVNAGHHRGASQVWRLVGDNHEPKSFDVWGAKCFAGIALEKIFPASTLSRAIVIKLRRKLPHESVGRLRHADEDVFVGIAAKLARFAADYSQQVRLARPVLPDELGDRAQDNWEPLIAIASCAGDEWIARATAAALKLSGSGEKTVSTGNELLSDVQYIFASKKLDRISTADLIAELCADDELSWSTYNRGQQLSPKQLSKLLKGYGIASKGIRISAFETPKGFELTQFSDAFGRYLATPLNLPPHPQQPLEDNEQAALTVAGYPQQEAIRNNAATSKAPYSLGCGGVADKSSVFEDATALI